MTETGSRHPIHAASLAEAGWLGDDGIPRAAGVLPLVLGDRLALALTFDRADLAVSLAGAAEVDLVVREPRNTADEWRPSGWRCHSTLQPDLAGDVYLDELLLQELRRYPPARRYADSPLLLREHWWYLPRLIVVLEPVTELAAPTPRVDADDLLLVSGRDRPVTSGVRVVDDRLEPTWGPAPEPGPGVVLGQDATFPDLEGWDTWTRPVEVSRGGVAAVEPLPARNPIAVPGLRARWRAQRRLAAGCRRGIDTWTG